MGLRLGLRDRGVGQGEPRLGFVYVLEADGDRVPVEGFHRELLESSEGLVAIHLQDRVCVPCSSFISVRLNQY